MPGLFCKLRRLGPDGGGQFERALGDGFVAVEMFLGSGKRFCVGGLGSGSRCDEGEHRALGGLRSGGGGGKPAVHGCGRGADAYEGRLAQSAFARFFGELLGLLFDGGGAAGVAGGGGRFVFFARLRDGVGAAEGLFGSDGADAIAKGFFGAAGHFFQKNADELMGVAVFRKPGEVFGLVELAGVLQKIEQARKMGSGFFDGRAQKLSEFFRFPNPMPKLVPGKDSVGFRCG